MRAIQYLLLTFFVAGSALAHEGHDHDKPAPLTLPVAPRITAVTPDYELVGVRSGASRLTMFLTTFATNEPVKGANVIVEGNGERAQAEARGDGLFEVSAPFLASPSSVDLVFSLTLPDGSQDLLTGRLEPQAETQIAATPVQSGNRMQLLLFAAGGIIAGILATLLLQPRRRVTGAETAEAQTTAASPDTKVRRVAALLLCGIALNLPGAEARAADAPAAPSIPSTMATDLAQRLPDGTLFVPKATQHLLSIRTMIVAESDIAHSAELTGTIVAAPNFFGRVQAAHSGRLEVTDSGLPYVGKKVTKGDLLGYLTPHIGTVERGTVQSQIAETDARIEMQKARLVRLRGAKLAIPPIKIDEAEGELAALQERSRELNPTLSLRQEIRAPVSGVISKAGFYAGQVIEPRDILFEIVDPAQFWVEASSYDPSLDAEKATTSAILASGKTLSLLYAGRGLTLREQAAPIMFRVEYSPEPIAIGQPVKVHISEKPNGRGIVAPAASVVRGVNGLPIVWVKAEAERFEPRPVKTAPLDGKNVVITAGIMPDMRIVTDGVTLLNQVR